MGLAAFNRARKQAEEKKKAEVKKVKVEHKKKSDK